MRTLKYLQTALIKLLILDQRVLYALLFRASQALVGIITILAITAIFTPVEQGYYYTFASMIALQTIFEMGLSFVILQFTGHEFATIHWSLARNIQGPTEKIKEFEGFLAKCFIAYSLIALSLFMIIWPIGLLFFTHAKHSSITWGLPWIYLCLATASNILMVPFLSVIEGSGLIVQIYRFRTVQNTIGAFGMWVAMLAGLNLYSIAIDPFLCFLITFIWIKYRYPDLFRKTYEGIIHLFNKSYQYSSQWMNDIWPMQWRIAISWISGYFLVQIYTPILFYYHDAISAGQLGASMTVCNMLSHFAITFMNAHNPEICKLIANKQWQPLQALFNRVFLHALLLATGAAIIILLALLVPSLHFITQRFVTPGEMLLLLMGTLINYMIGAIALFLRAFKREPFVWISLIGAFLNATLAWWFGKLYGTIGIATTYFLLNLFFGLPTAWWLWHKNTNHIWTEKLNHAFN